MNESSEELLADVDATLEQLVENAEALKAAKSNHAFSHELDALGAAQESLLARLMHRQSLLAMDKKKLTLDSIRKETIEKKVVEYAKSFKNRRQNAARLRKARCKS